MSTTLDTIANQDGLHTSVEDNAMRVIRAAQCGDATALVQLVETYQSYVYCVALGVMRQPADAAC